MTRDGKATVQELVDAGLAAYRRDPSGVLDLSNPRDVFVDRVVIAMRDLQGNIVGFAGRANPDAPPMRDGRPVPKYINTTTTAVFEKDQVLFGAELAQPGWGLLATVPSATPPSRYIPVFRQKMPLSY